MAIKMMTMQFVLMREYLSNACRQLLQFTLHHNFNICSDDDVAAAAAAAHDNDDDDDGDDEDDGNV